MKLAKNVFKSWSFWVSAVTAALVAFQQNMPALADTLSHDHYAALAVATPAVVAVLRMIKQRAVSGDDDA